MTAHDHLQRQCRAPDNDPVTTADTDTLDTGPPPVVRCSPAESRRRRELWKELNDQIMADRRNGSQPAGYRRPRRARARLATATASPASRAQPPAPARDRRPRVHPASRRWNKNDYAPVLARAGLATGSGTADDVIAGKHETLKYRVYRARHPEAKKASNDRRDKPAMAEYSRQRREEHPEEKRASNRATWSAGADRYNATRRAKSAAARIAAQPPAAGSAATARPPVPVVAAQP